MAKEPKMSVKVSKENPKAAKNFTKYMKEAEPKIIAAQEKFAKEMNKAVQAAIKKYVKEEKIVQTEAEKKATTEYVAKICANMCKQGDKMVKAEFKKMSQGMKKAIKEAK